MPAADVRKFLDEKPDAVGLGASGTPIGSPGMDFGEDRNAFNVFLTGQGGTTEVFSTYPGN